MPSINQGPYLETPIRSVLTRGFPKSRREPRDESNLGRIEARTTRLPAVVCKERVTKSSAQIRRHPADRGQAHALNKALTHATGDIVGWLNSDDCYLPGAFNRVARAFEENSDALVVHGDRLMIDSEGHVSRWTALPDFNPARTGYTICSETAFFRRAQNQEEHFPESLKFAVDLDFYCRLYRMGRFVKLPSYLGAFRCHSDNKSSTIHHVGRQEAEARWKIIFPAYPDGWQRAFPPSRLRMLFNFLRNPRSIALPYAYRRFYIGLRGIETG